MTNSQYWSLGGALLLITALLGITSGVLIGRTSRILAELRQQRTFGRREDPDRTQELRRTR